MLEIAVELAAYDPTYEELAQNYAVEFLLIARAMNGGPLSASWNRGPAAVAVDSTRRLCLDRPRGKPR